MRGQTRARILLEIYKDLAHLAMASENIQVIKQVLWRNSD